MIYSQILQDPLKLFCQFDIIEDPRADRRKKYPLLNILVFCFVAILSDQQSWYQIYNFCVYNLEWFAQYIDVSSGVPSHDTFRRVLSLLDTKVLENVIIQWTEENRNRNGCNRRVVILDGKTLKGVPWKVNATQLHILNAWEVETNTFVGQISIDSKTNEIKAAPELLEHMNLKNTIISVDAMMTQKEIAKIIINKQGDYIMALKGNQESLLEEVKMHFESNHFEIEKAQTIEKNSGKVEQRTCFKTDNIYELKCKNAWSGLKCIFKIESQIYYEGKTCSETRYFITSLNESPEKLLEMVRKHWSVENQLHRTLDVNFKEDACKEHDRWAAANLSILRKIAISLLKPIDPKKRMIWKMKEAAYSPSFRSRCLLGIF